MFSNGENAGPRVAAAPDAAAKKSWPAHRGVPPARSCAAHWSSMVSSSQVEGKSATYGGRNSKRRGPFPLTFAALACLCRPLEVHSKARTNGQDHRSAADVDAAARAGRDELFDGRDVVVVAERAGTFVLAAVRARGRRLRQSQARLREQVVERPAGAGLGRTTPLDGDRSRRRLALGTSTWHPAAGPRSS